LELAWKKSELGWDLDLTRIEHHMKVYGAETKCSSRIQMKLKNKEST
jgi:hypothetical protein